MRRALVVLLVAVVACGGEGGGGEGGRGGRGGWGGGKKADSAVVVELASAAPGTVVGTLVASGMVEAEAAADLMPAATGRVVQIAHDVGDPVRKGELLAVIQNETLDAGLDRARDEVATLRDRLSELKRLGEVGAVPQRDVDDAEANLRKAVTALREAEANARETRLVAPFDGVVALRDLKLGELASQGARAFQVVDLSSLRVVASLPERDVAKVRLGQPATVSGAYDADRKVEATVSRISPVVDATSGTFQVTMTLAAGDVLRPGQYADIALETERREGVLVVPRAAVVYESGRPLVYRVEAAPEEEPEAAKEDEAEEDGGWFAGLFGGGDGAAEDDAEDAEADAKDAAPAGPKRVARAVPVQLGLLDVDLAEITSGLSAGDAVVVVGQAHLKDGSAVREPNAADVAEGADAKDGAAGGAGDAPAADEAEAGE